MNIFKSHWSVNSASTIGTATRYVNSSPWTRLFLIITETRRPLRSQQSYFIHTRTKRSESCHIYTNAIVTGYYINLIVILARKLWVQDETIAREFASNYCTGRCNRISQFDTSPLVSVQRAYNYYFFLFFNITLYKRRDFRDGVSIRFEENKKQEKLSRSKNAAAAVRSHVTTTRNNMSVGKHSRYCSVLDEKETVSIAAFIDHRAHKNSPELLTNDIRIAPYGAICARVPFTICLNKTGIRIERGNEKRV